MDPFLQKFDEQQIRIASEVLSNWLPFISKGLCKECTKTLAKRIESINSDTITVSTPNIVDHNCSKDNNANSNEHEDTYSLGSWKDELSDHEPAESSITESVSAAVPVVKKSWADEAEEDNELELEEENEVESKFVGGNNSSGERTPVNEPTPKVELSRDQREHIRFGRVNRKKDFMCLERVNGKIMNILDGLELHTGVFSAAEQARIVNYVEQLREAGQNRQLKERTYTAPQKWMRGKGRVTLQFGCCYNYSTDRAGNPPGILKKGDVDPLPNLFKIMIKRLVRWHVLPPTCVPDSCIVNIYEEGDCIPPHIDNHDFVRPFCTVSFLSECEILFGSNLKIVGPGEFAGRHSIPLPLGSVLVLQGNGADVAKHCVPAVPTKRISITFRKMDESKWPSGYTPEPDLQGIEPLQVESNSSRKHHESSRSSRNVTVGRERNVTVGRDEVDSRRGGYYPDARYSGRNGRGRQGPVNRRSFTNNWEN